VRSNPERRKEQFSVKRIIEGLITTAIGAVIVVFAAVKVLESQTATLTQNQIDNRAETRQVAAKLETWIEKQTEINGQLTALISAHIAADNQKEKDDRNVNKHR